MALEHGCRSVSCTYNEPTIFAEYATDIMRLAVSERLKTVWVSNGYMSSSCLDATEPLLDAINIDLKSMDDAFYRRFCGARLQPVLENLGRFAASRTHLEVSTLLIPGFSDDETMLRRMEEFIAGELGSETPWHLLGFVPEISWKMKTVPGTARETFERVFDIGRKAGLRHGVPSMRRNPDRTAGLHDGPSRQQRELPAMRRSHGRIRRKEDAGKSMNNRHP